ncbi:hypothetical protein [Nocardioides sp. CFH 31398]|uniref:hypothetical protein n=1 Tax=Nocardioides sp. CFH 31398 TaxID=2919579 RepID=UPI001F062164|nr:hypothetical protein [Nocardioides sp. CFH 31398]MCH1866395.1 hypothetical protein [Nocardioides sp. CFH 31398]
MKYVLATLSGVFLAVALVLVLLSLSQLDEDYDTETSEECTTVPVPGGGGGSTQSCTGTEEAGGQVVLALAGAGFLVSGALLAVASVNVPGPQRPVAAAPAPWQGPPPRR